MSNQAMADRFLAMTPAQLPLPDFDATLVYSELNKKFGSDWAWDLADERFYMGGTMVSTTVYVYVPGMVLTGRYQSGVNDYGKNHLQAIVEACKPYMTVTYQGPDKGSKAPDTTSEVSPKSELSESKPSEQSSAVKAEEQATPQEQPQETPVPAPVDDKKEPEEGSPEWIERRKQELIDYTEKIILQCLKKEIPYLKFKALCEEVNDKKVEMVDKYGVTFPVPQFTNPREGEPTVTSVYPEDPKNNGFAPEGLREIRRKEAAKEEAARAKKEQEAKAKAEEAARAKRKAEVQEMIKNGPFTLFEGDPDFPIKTDPADEHRELITDILTSETIREKLANAKPDPVLPPDKAPADYDVPQARLRGFSQHQVDRVNSFKQRADIVNDTMFGYFISTWDKRLTSKSQLTPENVDAFVDWFDRLEQMGC